MAAVKKHLTEFLGFSELALKFGTGHEGTVDGTDKNCTFTQVHGICSLQNTIFVSDIAAGTIKLVLGLTSTVSFLHNLGCL